MRGLDRHCRMIGYKMRPGTDIVDSSSHFLMIGAQLWLGGSNGGLGGREGGLVDIELRVGEGHGKGLGGRKDSWDTWKWKEGWEAGWEGYEEGRLGRQGEMLGKHVCKKARSVRRD
jgi:hypothetical protein